VLLRLAVSGFRNLRSQQLEIPAGPIVLVGPNGSGKTNLLEAVAVLGNLSSFRSASLTSVVQRGASEYRLAGTVERAGAPVEISQTALLRKDVARSLFRGVRRLTAGEYLELFPVAPFSSHDRELVWGVPEERRRFLDRLSFYLRPETLLVVQRYRRTLRQRNALLATAASEGQFDAFEHDLALLGARLIHLRLQALAMLEKALEAEMGPLGWRLGRPNLRYNARGDEVAGDPASTADRLRGRLARSRRTDRERGRTLAGPHRHDLVTVVGGAPARDIVSAGQGKLLATGLKLAALAAVEQARGGRPTVVFDDVDSEFDAQTLAHVLVRLARKGQVLMSSAHEEMLLHRLDAASVWRMDAGEVQQATRGRGA
jgi:DNA replication and repair protein RecF